MYADITQQQYKSYFNNLRRTVRTLKEETGSANLYLTLGGLVYERNDRVVEAPLFLIPITLLATRGNDHVHIKVDSTHEASPNYCHGGMVKTGPQPGYSSALHATIRRIWAGHQLHRRGDFPAASGRQPAVHGHRNRKHYYR